MPLQVNH